MELQELTEKGNLTKSDLFQLMDMTPLTPTEKYNSTEAIMNRLNMTREYVMRLNEHTINNTMSSDNSTHFVESSNNRTTLGERNSNITTLDVTNLSALNVTNDAASFNLTNTTQILEPKPSLEIDTLLLANNTITPATPPPPVQKPMTREMHKGIKEGLNHFQDLSTMFPVIPERFRTRPRRETVTNNEYKSKSCMFCLQ